MTTLWFLYVLVGFSYTGTTIDRLETYQFDTEEHCIVERNRIHEELIEVYGDSLRILIYCKEQ